MGVFEALNETSNKALDSGESYIKHSKEYYKLKVFQQLTRSFSSITKLFITGGLVFLGIIFSTVAGAIWLGKVLDSTVVACLIIAGTLFLFSTISFLMRKKIDHYIIRKISKEFFD